MTLWVLAVDFGTSNTVAALRRPDGRIIDVSFDGAPLLPSAVFANPDGSLLVGRDAIHSMRLAPERFEPNPKLRIDDGVLLLGDEIPVATVFAAVLGRVAAEAQRVAGGSIGRVVLTHPAGWGSHRKAVLADAADRVGWRDVVLEAEPVAAARSFAEPDGSAGGSPVVVYDFGGGTFDVSVVRGTEVLATEGLPDAGGLDVDTAVIAYLEAVYRERDPAAWDRLRNPATPDDRRAWRQFADDVRTAKEMLSRHAQTFVRIPLVGVEAPVGREQVESVAGPLIDRTVKATKAAISAARLPLRPSGPVFLVGGASRMPLVATVLRQQLGVELIVSEQPELAVAHGALDSVDFTDQDQVTTAEPGDEGLTADEQPERPKRDDSTYIVGMPKHMHRSGNVLGTIAFSIAILAVFAATVDHSENQFIDKYGMQIIIGVIVGYFVGCGIGFLIPRDSLTVGLDALTIQKVGGLASDKTTAIAWSDLRKVRVVDDKKLVVWYVDGREPGSVSDVQRYGESGRVICGISDITENGNRADKIAELRLTLAWFAGDRYVES